MKLRELFALLAVLFGFGLNVAVWWFNWDFLNYLDKFIDPNKTKDFCFWLPFYVTCIRYSHWSLVFDTLFAISIIAFVIAIIGAYLLGRFRE